MTLSVLVVDNPAYLGIGQSDPILVVMFDVPPKSLAKTANYLH